jgi:hypothetical protein
MAAKIEADMSRICEKCKFNEDYDITRASFYRNAN